MFEVKSKTSEEPSADVRMMVAICASALIVIMDVMLAVMTARQLATAAYLTTEGTITSSRAVSDSDRRYRLEVAYSYAVGGRRFEGTRYEANDSSSSGSWAHDTAAALSQRPSVSVFYAPGDPSRAVLRQGIDGGDLFWLLFLVPFNVLVLGLWWGLAPARRAEAAGVPYKHPGFGPLSTALLVMAASAFGLVVVLALAFGSHPPLGAAVAAWLGMFLLAALGFFWSRARRRARR